MIFAVFGMCLCFGAQAWAANMLINGDFEDPGTTQGHPAGQWGPLGVAPGWGFTSLESWIHADCTDPPRYQDTTAIKIWADTATAWQEFPVSAGNPYTFTVEVFNPGSQLSCWDNSAPDTLTNLDAIIIAEWWTGPDGSGTLISSEEVARFVSAGAVTNVYVPISGVGTAAAGATYGRIVLTVENLGGGSGDANFDNAFVDLAIHPTKATGGIPDGGFFDPDTTTELTWTNPSTPPALTEVYFIESATILDPNETSPYYAGTLLDAASVYSSCTNQCQSTSVTLIEGKYYAWRVVCDGDASSDWIFNTVNIAPATDAGPDQNAWLASNTVDVDLDGTGTVDLDDYPGNPLTYTWTYVSGPAVIDPDDVVSPTVTLTIAGPYVFQLESSDGLDSATDEVTITVYAEADSRLAAHWKFEDNLLATVGTGIDGTAGGTNPIGYVNGVAADGGPAGKALSLDGTNYVEILSTMADPSILHYDDQITVSAWIRGNGTSFGPQFAGVVTKGDSSWRVAIDGGGGSAEFACTGVGNNEYGAISGVQGINDGNWHHVVGTYDGAQIKIYIDGVLDNAEDASDPIDLNAFGVVIGANDEEAGRAIIADIDEVRIFDKGLTAARVLAMYADDGGGNACGQDYADSDFNEDCRTDDKDLLLLVAEWLDCTDLTGVNCN